MPSAAEERLEACVGEVLAERGILREGEVLGDWLVMVEVSLLGEGSRGMTKYGNIIPGDDGFPIHRVLGLIEVCTDLLEEG